MKTATKNVIIRLSCQEKLAFDVETGNFIVFEEANSYYDAYGTTLADPLSVQGAANYNEVIDLIL